MSFFKAHRRELTEVLLIAIAFFVYFGVRGLVVERIAEAEQNASDLIALEKALGIYWEADLQRLVVVEDWIQRVVNGIYLYGHGPVIAVIGVLLYVRKRPVYLLTRNTLLLSGAIGLVIYTTYPVAPPRLVPEADFVDTVLREYHVRRVLMPGFLTNEYAAVPSLHFGWNMVMGIAVWIAFPNVPARIFAVVMPLLMLVAIVVTANHFILDAVAGAIVAAAGAALAFTIHRYAQRRFRGDGDLHEAIRWFAGVFHHSDYPGRQTAR